MATYIKPANPFSFRDFIAARWVKLEADGAASVHQIGNDPKVVVINVTERSDYRAAPRLAGEEAAIVRVGEID